MSEFQLGIILAVIILLGIFGNILSFVVLILGQRCRKLFCTAYLIALTITDTLILAFPALELCIYLLNENLTLRNLSQFLCKLMYFFIYYGPHISTWIVVGVSGVRAISIWLPLRSPAWRNKHAMSYILIIVTIFFVIDLPFLISAERISITLNGSSFMDLSAILKELNLTEFGNFTGLNGTAEVNNSSADLEDLIVDLKICQLRQDSIYAKGSLLEPLVLQLSFCFAIPFFVITLCNLLIIVKLLRRMRGLNTDSASQTNIKDSRMVSLTMRIFILSIVYCISTGPITIIEVMKASSIEYRVLFIKNRTLFRFFNLLFYLNSSVNFILYCLFGNEFRQDLYTLMKLKRR